jgi:hypothetical protein
MGLAFGSRCSSCSINSLGTPSMSVGFHAKMSLFSWRNLLSASSYLGSKLVPTRATLEGSSVDNRTVLLSESSGWMDVFEVLASSMTGSEGAGGLSQGLVQVLELRGLCESIGRLMALPIAIVGTLDVSLDGDDIM